MLYVIPDAALNGNGFFIETRSIGENTNIPANVNVVMTGGYSTPGDGGAAEFHRVAGPLADGASFQSDDGAWWLLSSDIICVEMFGAVSNGANDETSNFIAAVAFSDTVYTTANKTYRVDDTIILGPNKTIYHPANAMITRVAASPNTTPIIVLGGNNCGLMGRGTVHTEKASPNGVILIGAIDTAINTNVNWAALTDIQILGTVGVSDQPGNCGLKLQSSEPVVGGSCYNTQAHNVRIFLFFIGVESTEQCNGNTLVGFYFWQIVNACFYVHGTNSENRFDAAFVHFSFGAIVFAINNSDRNICSAIAEPGGASQFFIIANNCNACEFWGVDNTGNAPLNNGNNTIIRLNYVTSLGSPGFDLAQVRIPSQAVIGGLQYGGLRLAQGAALLGAPVNGDVETFNNRLYYKINRGRMSVVLEYEETANYTNAALPVGYTNTQINFPLLVAGDKVIVTNPKLAAGVFIVAAFVAANQTLEVLIQNYGGAPANVNANITIAKLLT